MPASVTGRPGQGHPEAASGRCRPAPAEIAEAVNLSAPAVQRRIARWSGTASSGGRSPSSIPSRSAFDHRPGGGHLDQRPFATVSAVKAFFREAPECSNAIA